MKEKTCVSCAVPLSKEHKEETCDRCYKSWAFEEFSDEMPDKYYEDEPSDSDTGWDLGKEETL